MSVPAGRLNLSDEQLSTCSHALRIAEKVYRDNAALFPALDSEFRVQATAADFLSHLLEESL